MWWEAQLKDADQCTRSNLTSVAEEKVTDPGQNESMKGSLKMWSIFPVFSSCETEMSSFHLVQLGLELYLPVSIHHSIYSLKGTN